jgi:hypothetical protein
MKYGITQLRLDMHTFFELSESEYKGVLTSKNNLIESLYIEEKLNILIENYKEFEMELMDSSVSQMLFPIFNESWYSNQRNQINRKIVNLLTACRLYLDQIPHHLNNIYGKKSSNTNFIKQQISEVYDSHLSYRIMEALRNHVQHRGFPIHTCSYHRKRIENEEKIYFLHTLTPQINIEELKNNKKLKKSVLDEMKILGENIDIKPITREYIESIGKIHEKIRKMLSEDITSWQKNIDSVIHQFKMKYGEDLVELAAVSVEDDGSYNESTQLFKEFVNRRLELERKNYTFKGLSSQYATNQSIE